MHNMLVLPLRECILEPFWNRNHVESVQITMARTFGVQGRGAFYDQTGAIRDVVQNHLFQILSNLAMEPPVRTDSESIRDEKVKVLKAIAPLDTKQIVRGQFRGYRKEKGVAPTRKWKPLPRCGWRSILALARRSVLHPGREMLARDLHGDLDPLTAAAALYSSASLRRTTYGSGSARR